MSQPPFIIDHIMHVMEAAFDPAYGEAWNRRQIADALVLPSTHALLVDTNGDVVGEKSSAPAGFVLSRHAADEEELLLIAVLPGCRESGLGTLLINEFMSCARKRGVTKLFLEMRKGNPAVHLYQKVGFKPIGERPNYYRMIDGSRIDAITFGRTL